MASLQPFPSRPSAGTDIPRRFLKIAPRKSCARTGFASGRKSRPEIGEVSSGTTPFHPGGQDKILFISNRTLHLATLGAWPCKFHFKLLKGVERDRTDSYIVNHADQAGRECWLF
jgi:hypothetical protein